MIPASQDTQPNLRVCGQCQAPCHQNDHNCSYCREPVCASCLIEYSITSRTHDGMIFHHTSCDEKSSAKNFQLPHSMRSTNVAD